MRFGTRSPGSMPTAVAICVALAVLGLNAGARADEPVPPKSQRAPQVRLPARRVVLPIVMVREFPFVDASIAGVKGKLMLDTGAEQALAINDHRVPVAGGRAIGTGHFGSGQTFAVRLVPEIRDVRIGPLDLLRATTVQAQDARMLEDITPDFIGWLGHDAWADHALMLDYDRATATFVTESASAYLRDQKVAASLPFETRRLPNQPLMPGRIGAMPIVSAWDTGQYGTLYTSEAGKARLLREGRLTPSTEREESYDLHGLIIDGHPMPDIRGIGVETTVFAAAAPIGITEPDVLTIGYGLLRQFRTVWDYRSHVIHLLER